MQVIRYFTLIYSVMVFVGGFMAYGYEGRITALTIEVLLGAALFISSLMMQKWRKKAEYACGGISFFLFIFYSVYFSSTHDFFFGLLAGISFFVAATFAVRIFGLNK